MSKCDILDKKERRDMKQAMIKEEALTREIATKSMEHKRGDMVDLNQTLPT